MANDLIATETELFYIDVAMTTVFLVDIVLNCFTAYYEKGKIVTDHGKIVHHYLRTWFVLDIVCTVPFDWIILFFSEADTE
jgi:hypothetical protein